MAHLGVRARPFSYAIHGIPLPTVDVAVRLTGPDGDQWSWGESSDDTISGSALDFCLVVTQRRHLADTRLSVVGDAAAEWIAIAQTFAGGAGSLVQQGFDILQHHFGIGDEFIGILFRDEEDDGSYQFQMAILDVDLAE